MFFAGVSLPEDFDAGLHKAPKKGDANSLIHSAVQMEACLGEESRGGAVRTGSGEECIRETPILSLAHGHVDMEGERSRYEEVEKDEWYRIEE